jgi:hypothetical protein
VPTPLVVLLPETVLLVTVSAGLPLDQRFTMAPP